SLLRKRLKKILLLATPAPATFVACGSDLTGGVPGPDAANECSAPCSCYTPTSRVITQPVTCAGDAGDESETDLSDASSACPAAGDTIPCHKACPDIQPGGTPLFLLFCSPVMADAGAFYVECHYQGPPCGRRTEGTGTPRIRAQSEVASHLAVCAFL